jgi:hypothetical protein
MILEIEFEPYSACIDGEDFEQLIEAPSVVRIEVIASRRAEGGSICWFLSCLPDIVFKLPTRFDYAGSHAHIYYISTSKIYLLFVGLVLPSGESLGFEIPLKRVTEVRSFHPLPN